MDGNVMERNDYYTFGKRHTSGRSYSSLASSPFLFSGKEDQSLAKRIADQDATASVSLNFLNFGARHYDPVVPRWLTVDPLSEKYYNLNPYSYCAADPVTLVDPDGRRIKIWYRTTNSTGKTAWMSFSYSGKESITINNQYVKDVISAYNFNKDNWAKSKFDGKNPLVELVERDETTSIIDYGVDAITIQENGGTPYICWSSDRGSKFETGIIVSPSTILAHEAEHANDIINDVYNHNLRVSQNDSQYDNKEERRVITGVEQKVARANGEIKEGQVTRMDHLGKTVFVQSPTSIEKR